MSEDQIEGVLSALNNPIRRGIVCYLAESGPKDYTTLLKKFKLQTGTLNHHLEVLKPLFDQDEDKRYFLNRNGHIAYQLLTYARASFAKPVFPAVRRTTIFPALRNTPLSFQKLIFHPAKAFVEAQEHLGQYALCGAIVITLFFVSIPSLSPYAIAGSFTGLLGVILLCFAFAHLAYRKDLRLSRLTVSISMAYLPAIALNFLSPLFATLELAPGTSQPFTFVENPVYVAVTQVFAAMFIWRFILLFFAIRESCKLSTRQSFETVFASSIIENVVRFVLDYLFRMPMMFP